jgi:hypothetical protein
MPGVDWRAAGWFRAGLRRLLLFALLLATGLVVLGWLPLGPAVRAQTTGTLRPSGGALLAPVGRQVGWLSFDAPRARLLTGFVAPAYAADAVATAAGAQAAVTVVAPFGGAAGADVGGDLVRLDLASGQTAPLVSRADPDESLGAPAWLADGGGLLFQREDLRRAPIAYPGMATVSYPSRIELVRPDGAGRAVVADDARQPAPSPDGGTVAYLRSTRQGTALLARPLAGGQERPLVPLGRFTALASPRFSPSGDRIALMAPGDVVGRPGLPVIGPAAAYAHGLPWDLWLINADGSGLHRVAQLAADDASVTWSPDGGQLFVYGGAGSFVVDPVTGDSSGFAYLAGYGATTWLPAAP